MIAHSKSKKPRVLVAMSGGVDSSVAALKLLEEGYDVVGVTFQLYDYERKNRKEGKGGCCSLEDVDDARKVADKIGIRHYLFDTREDFKKRVVNYFTESYRRGETPNPCMACNTFIKFDELAHYAKVVDADFYATGHYARLWKDEKLNRTFIRAAEDPEKDQSYFLMGVASAHLEKILFPLGEFTKDQIRQMAEKANLPVSHKPDSQEVCFIPDNNYRRFLKEEAGVIGKPGKIVDERGNILAEHSGIQNFTIGQKKGLGALGIHNRYVIRLDADSNQVVVGDAEEMLTTELPFSAKYFPHAAQYLGQTLYVKIRSRASKVPAKIVRVEENTVWAELDAAQRAVTPGQFAVFYDDLLCVVGGGPILRPTSSSDRNPYAAVANS